MIHELSDVILTVRPGGWPLDPALRARIDEHWAGLVARNPSLWNGRIFGTLAAGRPGGISIVDGVLTASAVEGDYAGFLAWRDWGFPEIGIRNLFGSAVIRSADGAILYGLMGAHTANAGTIYPAGGSLEPRDVQVDGSIDVLGSIALELEEETGLRASEANAGPLLAVFDGALVSIARVFRFAQPADDLAHRIRSNLAAQEHRELEDVAILRSGADLVDGRIKPFARRLAAHLLPG